ncbi:MULTISPECIES: BufA1 family periplasmic bufferin-type metallophore [Inquilinus]|uniref:Membrane protein n=1 Tax=Inquilinus ginsengisoli TaxID=363840 RepID=A0ABU1JWC6_9PROT|nr:DUF2282 domain-containing protein [Inquilinus ginsengisoli]MDR6292918.1 putative membrane protein [Inquilinus ginsengisoli]
MTSKTAALNIASALFGAVALAAIVAPPAANAADLAKCYGISLAGQNSCANQAGTHSCAGQSKVNYDGSEWRAVGSAAICTELGGQAQAFKGVNPKKA